ncbi:MAG TPA: putative zinc-binding metallopeptidase [Haliangiales bacterium]|nr:putative zinc-binding metallopeptidase [Haliangiales bacterium]
MDELGLNLEMSPLQPLIDRLYQELAAAGIDFRPLVFVANEWGCPDGIPLIGIPFYLVDPRFHPYEEEHADDVEEAERILVGLRHEAGHAINYAYRLYNDPEWQAIFGAYDKAYHDDYRPEPFSRRCVRHLPGWYAQKHPDEDFAETFAVWLTPGVDWRKKYAGWEALAKLEYMDRIMKRIGHQAPVIDPLTVTPDPDELAFTVGDYYRQRAKADAPPVDDIGSFLDDDLGEIFRAEGPGADAASLLWDRRRAIMRTVSAYTGARMYVVKALIVFLVHRLRALSLRAVGETDAIIAVTALVTALTQNFVRTGHFVSPPERRAAA